MTADRHSFRRKNMQGTVILIALLVGVVVLTGSEHLVAGVQPDSWVAKASLPTPRSSLCPCADVMDGLIYVVGGAVPPIVGLSANEVYDPSSDSWSTRAPMPTPRSELATAVVSGKLYAIGGLNDPSGWWSLSVNEVYDPASNTWSTKAPMPTRRHDIAAAVVNGKIYVIGGYSPPIDAQHALATNEMYDPASDTWISLAPMPIPSRNHVAVVVGGKIYVIGGQEPNGRGIHSAVQVYDPSTNTWTLKSPMPTPRDEFSAAEFRGKIYAIGGRSPTFADLDVNEEYDTMTDTWTKRAPLPMARQGTAAAQVGDLVYVVGGFAGGIVVNTSEAYAPPTTSILFTESFDQYVVGSFPTGWDCWWTGAGFSQQYVTNVVFVSPDNSLRLLGSRGLPAYVAHSFESSARYVGYEACVRTGTYRGSSYHLARVGFAKLVDSWGSELYAGVCFIDDGTITIVGKPIQTYSPNTWYTISVVLDRDTSLYNVSIDGVHKGSFVTPFSSEKLYAMTSFNLASEIAAVECFFDDVRVFEGPIEIPLDTTPPATPTLLLPTNGTLTNNNKSTFDWSDVTDPSGVKYTLQVDDDANFASPEINVSGLIASAFTPTTALSDGKCYWRVRAEDGAGNVGSFTSPFSIVVDTTPPPYPTPLSPKNGSFTNNNKPTFDWSNVTDPSGVRYVLQVDNNADFTSPEVNASGLEATEFTLATSLPDGLYHWRVGAVDGANNTLGLMASLVTIDTIPPTITVNLNGTLSADGRYYTSNVVVTLQTSEDAVVKYSLNDAAYLNYSGPFTISTSGVWNIRVSATDAAGNVGTRNATVSILHLLPVKDMFKANRTVPVAFTVRGSTNGSFVHDETVEVYIVGPSGYVRKFVYGTRDGDVKIVDASEYYMFNWRLNDLPALNTYYTIRVYFRKVLCMEWQVFVRN
jgi:N-acetylneuraminic acid mutarotase